MIENRKRIIEALIFSAEEPLEPRTIAAVIETVTAGTSPDLFEIESGVEALNEEYESTGRVFRIRKWAGGYRMATVPAMAPYLKAMYEDRSEKRLSRSLMETLAIIAYRQPVTRPEIDFVRGVDSDYSLRKLLERNFVEVVGRSEAVGRPLLYGTTDFFLEQFGLDNLGDLPKPREIEDLLNDPAFNQERARLLSKGGYTVEKNGTE